MKKMNMFLFTVVLLTAILAGCSGGSSGGSSGSSSGGSSATDPANITGETFDGGNVSALVPDGWMGFHGTDYFDEYEEGYNPNVIQICKGAESEWDQLSTPYVMISYYGPDNPMFEPSKDFYEEGADLEPVTLGDYTWKGFTAKSLDTPIAILWTGEEGSDQLQLTICLENGSKISLEDADVQAIIASINISK